MQQKENPETHKGKKPFLKISLENGPTQVSGTTVLAVFCNSLEMPLLSRARQEAAQKSPSGERGLSLGEELVHNLGI